MMYQCGRCGLTRASGQEMGVIQQCKCPWEFTPPVMPQQSAWVGLTSEERMDIIVKHNGNRFQVADEIEEKLRSKNT